MDTLASSYSSLESRLSELGEEMRRAAGEAAALEARSVRYTHKHKMFLGVT